MQGEFAWKLAKPVAQDEDDPTRAMMTTIGMSYCLQYWPNPDISSWKSLLRVCCEQGREEEHDDQDPLLLLPTEQGVAESFDEGEEETMMKVSQFDATANELNKK